MNTRGQTCFRKFPTIRPQNRQKPKSKKQNNGMKRYCKFFEKDGNTEGKCFSLERAGRKLKA
jgi:hypothetical protein